MKIIDKFLSSKFVMAGSLNAGETFLIGNDLYIATHQAEPGQVISSVLLSTGKPTPLKADTEVLPVKIEIHMVDVGR